MKADVVIRARVSSEIRDQAVQALERMGLTMSDALRMLVTKIAAEQRLPFEVSVPNAITVAAMKEADELAERSEGFDDVDLVNKHER